MPLYAYKCQNCDTTFELLIDSSEAPACPACGGGALLRQLSRISREIKYPAIARSWRQAAASSGDISNFSAAERAMKKS